MIRYVLIALYVEEKYDTLFCFEGDKMPWKTDSRSKVVLKWTYLAAKRVSLYLTN